ncbi:endonuclease III [Isosphaeraceae bacterium EP7]
MPRQAPTPAELDPKRQAGRVVRALVKLYPEPRCALVHRDAFELLVATILSAQCTDVRVNMVTPALFALYPDARALAAADLAEVERLVHSTGFFRAKAANLVAMAGRLVELHGGQVPRDLEALTALPGVGRKTAHVVMGNAFRIPSGVVVDTHVKRLSMRLGLTTKTDPERVERDLEAIVPKSHWIDFSHRLIEHGRRTCIALRPRCDACELASFCPQIGVTTRGV